MHQNTDVTKSTHAVFSVYVWLNQDFIRKKDVFWGKGGMIKISDGKGRTATKFSSVST